STSYIFNSETGTSYAVNAEVSYASNSETGTSYIVNAEVSTLCIVIFEQAANIKSSTSYAKASTASAFNAEFGFSYMVNVQTNTSCMIDIETNTFCENAVYDDATTKEIDNIDISNTIYEVM
ncbi:14303_t:CDS:1, partial [Gigaspora margarita]